MMKLRGAGLYFLLLAMTLFGATPPATQQGPVRVGVSATERRITLDEVIELALKNNLEIEIERTGIASAQESLEGAFGVYDGVFHWQPNYENRKTPTSSVLLGADGKLAETFHNQNFAFDQRVPWKNGGAFHAGFDNSRQSTSNPFTGLTPFTQSRLFVNWTQPLVRNRLFDRERGEIKIRSKSINVSEIDLQLRGIDVVARVEYAYWDLVAARQDVGVKAEGVQWAREQLARNKRMIDSGTLAPVELVAAEAELERRLDTYYASVGLVTEVENSLKTLIASGRDDTIWSDALVPSEERAPGSAATDDVAGTVAIAMQKRAELRQIGLRREVNDVQKAIATEQLKPQINLVAGYAASGLAGSVSAAAANNPFAQSTALTTARLNELSTRAGLAPLPVTSFGGTPASLIGSYGSTLSNLFGFGYQTVQVGVTMDWNVRNRATESAVSQAVIADRRLKLEQARTEQAIAAQVRNALQAIETARQRIVAAEASARAAKEKVDSETRLFQNGESTNFFVLTRQNEYTDSLRRVVVSRLELNKAVARLRQATGETLESHKVSVSK